MILAWIFRVVFLPLLVLAIVTSNGGPVESAPEAAAALDDTLALAVRTCCLWWDMPPFWAPARARPDCGLLIEFL